MIPSMTIPAIAPYIAGALATALVGMYSGSWLKGRASSGSLEEVEFEEGHGFTLPPVKGESRIASALEAYGQRRKKERAVRKGYVRWFLVGSSVSEPMYVMPERKNGGNLPELRHKGETYYFPENALIPSAEDGVPVMMHRRGEADPIPLGDPWDLAVDAGTLDEYLNLRVTTSAPEKRKGGLIPGLGAIGDMDSMEMMRYLVIGIIVIFVALEFLG